MVKTLSEMAPGGATRLQISMRGVDWLLVFRFVDIPLSGERQSKSTENRQQLVEPNARGISQLERCEQAFRNTGLFSEGGTGETLSLACLAHVDASLARCGDGKGIHGDLLTCRLLHPSMTCKSLHEKASCKTLHEALYWRLVLSDCVWHYSAKIPRCSSKILSPMRTSTTPPTMVAGFS